VHIYSCAVVCVSLLHVSTPTVRNQLARNIRKILVPVADRPSSRHRKL